LDDEISFLFLQPFLPGNPRTPDCLTREAYIVHYALRRSVLYRMGNAESLTGVQQWLLMYVMAKCLLDIVDILISEIEDAIMDGRGMTRQQPFAHWISWLLSRLEAQRYVGMLEQSKFVFPTYRTLMPGDRRRGPRSLRRAEETLQARAVAEAMMDVAAGQDATLAAAESPLPQYLRQTTSPLAMTTTLYLLLSQCSGFTVLTTTRPAVLLCQDRERLSHRFLLKLPLLR
jgi:hypothetical protein